MSLSRVAILTLVILGLLNSTLCFNITEGRRIRPRQGETPPPFYETPPPFYETPPPFTDTPPPFTNTPVTTPPPYTTVATTGAPGTSDVNQCFTQPLGWGFCHPTPGVPTYPRYYFDANRKDCVMSSRDCSCVKSTNNYPTYAACIATCYYVSRFYMNGVAPPVPGLPPVPTIPSYPSYPTPPMPPTVPPTLPPTPPPTIPPLPTFPTAPSVPFHTHPLPGYGVNSLGVNSIGFPFNWNPYGYPRYPFLFSDKDKNGTDSKPQKKHHSKYDKKPMRNRLGKS